MTSSISDLWVPESIPKERVDDKFVQNILEIVEFYSSSTLYIKGHCKLLKSNYKFTFAYPFCGLAFAIYIFFSGEFMRIVKWANGLKLIRFLLSNRFIL